MRTRSSFVVALALLAAACGNKDRSEPTPTGNGDEKYINQDLAPYLAQVEAAVGPLSKIGPTELTRGRELVTARSYLAGFLVGASKLTPPAAWKASLESLVAIVTDMASVVDELQMATDANQPDTFTPAHAKLTAALKRYTEWKAALTNGLASAHITQAPLPAPPEPTTKPPVVDEPMPCGGPCPCTATSIEKKGDVITACILSRDYGVSGVYCGAGKVLFDAKTGELTDCIAAAMFSPYAIETAGTPTERVAVCGAGPVTKAAFGITSCVLDADLVVGPDDAKTTIKKTARVFYSAPLKIERAVTTEGEATCFDETGKRIGCK